MGRIGWVAALFLFISAGCGDEGGGGTCEPGAEGCPCVQGGLCLGTLQCLSNICVNTGQPPTTTPPEMTTSTPEPTTSGGSNDCPEGQTRCGDACVDLAGDPAHCGGCDEACADGGVCADGECATVADCTVEACPGLTYCDQASKKCLPGCAFNPQCGAGEYCDTASHTCACNEGFHDCDGVCKKNDDPKTCGDACSPCPVPDNAEPTCEDGECGFVCVQGWRACNDQCVPDDWVICGDNKATCTPCPMDPYGWAICDQAYHYCRVDCHTTGYYECGPIMNQVCKLKSGGECTKDEDCCEYDGYECNVGGYCTLK